MALPERKSVLLLRWITFTAATNATSCMGPWHKYWRPKKAQSDIHQWTHLDNLVTECFLGDWALMWPSHSLYTPMSIHPPLSLTSVSLSFQILLFQSHNKIVLRRSQSQLYSYLGSCLLLRIVFTAWNISQEELFPFCYLEPLMS